VDFLSAKYVDKIGYKPSVITAHVCAFIGLVSMGVLPYLFSNAYFGMLMAVTFYAIGGGIIEVIISPIVEALPTDEKSTAMSLLHSFYCWGHVSVVLLSTLFFSTIGISNWRVLPIIWAIVPLCNIILFSISPVKPPVEEHEKLPIKKLFSSKIFWLFFILMICSGASEQAMSQWVSYFAEKGLNISKSMGDIFGICMFAILMGISRVFYGKFGKKINLQKFIFISGLLCVVSYMLAVFSPFPILSLIGCALCGLSVGIMWPGTFSLASQKYPQGGTAMFAFLALAGDVGCSSGPSTVGVVSDFFSGNIKAGLLVATIFPILLLVCVSILKSNKRKKMIGY